MARFVLLFTHLTTPPQADRTFLNFSPDLTLGNKNGALALELINGRLLAKVAVNKWPQMGGGDFMDGFHIIRGKENE